MARTRYSRRSSINALGPIITFLLVASLGILMVGCGGGGSDTEEYTFTADDVEKFEELINEEEGKELIDTENTQELSITEGTGENVAIDDSTQALFSAIRAAPSAEGENTYKVVNAFLNVRDSASVRGGEVYRLDQGDTLTVTEFVDAVWAKVTLPNGKEGYVSHRYIAKLTAEDRLPEEKKAFENRYYVNFSFLNVRSQPSTGAEKIGELPGQAFVTPLNVDGQWARISFEGKEGYVSAQYLEPFLPKFLVRQNKFTLPVLVYDVAETGVTDNLVKHIAALQENGMNILTLRDFYEVLIRQEERDIRLEPRSVIIGITGLNKDNFKEVNDVLRASRVAVSFFIKTGNTGPEGLTENRLLTLAANGHDIQSAAHSGDDLRSMTNAQVDIELGQGRALVEQAVDETVLAVKYPKGGVNDRIMQKAAELGYLFGIGAAPNRTFTRDQLLRMPSFAVSRSMTTDEVIKIVKGE